MGPLTIQVGFCSRPKDGVYKGWIARVEVFGAVPFPLVSRCGILNICAVYTDRVKVGDGRCRAKIGKPSKADSKAASCASNVPRGFKNRDRGIRFLDRGRRLAYGASHRAVR